MTMISLCVAKTIGPVCVDPDDGDRLREQCRPSLAGGDRVNLDFTGVTALTTSFLFAAVGKLFADLPAEVVQECLSWSGLDPRDEKLMGLVLKRAAHFHAASPDQQAAMIAASAHAIEG